MKQATYLHQDHTKGLLARETTTCLRGILLLAIIACHWRSRAAFLADTIPGMMLTAAGYLGVGVFFFLSGYGLREQGKGYLKRFPRHRLAPYYVTYLVALGIYVLANRVLPSMSELLRSLTWYGTIVDYGWYLQAQLLLYLLFWILYRGEKDSLWQPFLLVGIYILLVAPMKNFLWIESILCFPLGLWWSDHKKEAETYIQSHWGVMFLLVFVLFGITVLLGNLPILPVWPMRVVKMLSAVFFTVFVILFIAKVPIQCAVTRYLGTISGEAYVMQGLGFRLLMPLWEADRLWAYLLGVAAVSFAGGSLLHIVNTRIYAYFKRA